MHSKNFVIWPKIDFVFKKIMTNPKALKGFSSAVLDISPDSIESMILKNTNLKKSMRRKNKAFLMIGKIKYNLLKATRLVWLSCIWG